MLIIAKSKEALMLGLLYKDFLLIRKNVLLGIFLIAAAEAFAIIFILGMNVGNFQAIKELSDIYDMFFKGSIYSFCIAGVSVAMTSFSSIEKDEKAEWYKVLYASPVNAFKEVASRYIVAFVINTIMSVWIAILLPLVYKAGEVSCGFAQLKVVAYCWIIGMCAIMIRLPIDIIFSAKMSVLISCSTMFVIMVALMAWIFKEEADVVFAKLAEWMDKVYDYRVLVVALIAIISFSVSYFVKKNRRWA
ncbi:MAG: hypothetical protein E7252_09510 [Lachnospira sp.]|nr:hypothetical protein [Lachnospira sp.]